MDPYNSVMNDEWLEGNLSYLKSVEKLNGKIGWRFLQGILNHISRLYIETKALYKDNERLRAELDKYTEQKQEVKPVTSEEVYPNRDKSNFVGD